MKELNYNKTREMLIYTAKAVIDAKPTLTEIDSRIGDGDHGIGMARGMENAIAKLSDMPCGENAFSLFTEMGKVMLMTMGGASGVIFGSMFMGGAKGKSAAALNGESFVALFTDSLKVIQDRGKAQVGDKTMVDALSPAVDAMNAYINCDLVEFFSAAEQAACAGVEATKMQIAKFGRAKSLMERAIGYQDAGATSTYIIFKAMREYCEGLQ